MGLLKRLLSLGNKKNKKQRPPIVHDIPLAEESWTRISSSNEEEHEAAVGRLLRSSSARFVEHSTLDYATLPPLPHPINRVIQTPASSSVSLASTSLSGRGTYNVTVHKRKRYTSTEFQNTDQEGKEIPDDDIHYRTSLQPLEDSRVIRLWSDPSVSSLLDLYDDDGKLANDAFSNSPPTSPTSDGRAQVRRNGSTLRQLLGAPLDLNIGDPNESSSAEGDISWAERYLAETEGTSSNSSLGLHTPTTTFPCELQEPEISFVTEGSISNITSDNSAISSMEVELSTSADTSQDLEDRYEQNNPYGNSNPNTPQRASQIFGFLTKGKQSKPAQGLDRSLPDLPSRFSTPMHEDARHNIISHFRKELPKFQSGSTCFPATPRSHVDDTPRNRRPHSNLIENTPSARDYAYRRPAFSDDSHDTQHVPKPEFHDHENLTLNLMDREDKQNAIKVLMNGPTKVIVTAPTPSSHHDGPSRLPRGPRAVPRKSSSGHHRTALVEVSNSAPDPLTANQFRRRAQGHKRSGSQSSTHSVSQARHQQYQEHSSAIRKIDVSTGRRKENQKQLGLAVNAELPSTPLRSNTNASHSLLRAVVQNAMFRPPLPSPNSSSEMSPMGRQIMMDVRQQRINARVAERGRFERYPQRA